MSDRNRTKNSLSGRTGPDGAYGAERRPSRANCMSGQDSQMNNVFYTSFFGFFFFTRPVVRGRALRL